MEDLNELLEEEGPNEPASFKGTSMTGPRVPISPEKARKRRMAMSQALMNGTSFDALIEHFGGADFDHMSEASIFALRKEVKLRWQQEDRENLGLERSAAVRRIRLHIQKATAAGRWAAIAALEKVLADIQGTITPEVPVDIDSRITDAVRHVMGELHNQAEVNKLINEQREFLDTQGEEVSSRVAR